MNSTEHRDPTSTRPPRHETKTSRVVRWLASIPTVFDGLRWILEGGYHGHETVFQQELNPVATASSSAGILDLGCGTGLHAARFCSEQYHGIDLSDAYIKAARRKHPTYSFECADARKLPFADGHFHTVLISGVLHHLNDNDALSVLKEAARVLSPDGRVVIWEDIPTVGPWNFVGALIHRLDQGQWIRTPASYRQLIDQSFAIHNERCFRSGFMDYAVFRASPRTKVTQRDSENL